MTLCMAESDSGIVNIINVILVFADTNEYNVMC
jgi:hypothetical protein